jgi:serine/threonine protein kinase
VSSLTHLQAQRVLAQQLEEDPALDGPGVDELCRSHPELEESLRELARERSESTIEPPRVGSTYVKKLRREGASRNRYVLLGEVARGETAVILRVWDALMERPLAMKLLDTAALPKDSDEAEAATARFLNEARIAGQLEHPGVVPIHDLGADERGRVYFTMPFFEGRNLDEVFELLRSRSEGWSLGRALLLLAKVCEIMAYAHSRGVIHRDLKPSNLIAGAFGEVYVVDWGLAKELEPLGSAPAAGSERGGQVEPEDARAGQTLDGTVAGTPPYMAPEQAEGRVAEVSYRSDVYAMGAMLYRLLAGRAPYAPRHGRDEPSKTVELIRRGPPTPLERLAPDAPKELVAISAKAMARDPKDRYASLEDLARDLQAYLEGRVGEVERP